MKGIAQFFRVVLFITLYKMAFKSVEETLVYFLLHVQSGSNV